MATNDSYSKMSLEGDASQERLCELLLQKYQIEQEISSLANGTMMPSAFTYSCTTEQFEMSVSYRRKAPQGDTDIITPIKQLIDMLNDDDFGEEYSKDVVKDIFEQLVNGDFKDYNLRDAQKNLVCDFCKKKTKYEFGNLKLLPFLKVVGYLIDKEVLRIEATRLIMERWFPDYGMEAQDTLRSYVSKWSTLSANQKLLLDKII